MRPVKSSILCAVQSTYGSPRWSHPEHIVTNGAFRITLRRIRDRIRLEKSENYWDREHVRLNVIDALAIKADGWGPAEGNDSGVSCARRRRNSGTGRANVPW